MDLNGLEDVMFCIFSGTNETNSLSVMDSTANSLFVTLYSIVF